MNVVYNPFTDELDFTGSGGGGSTTGFWKTDGSSSPSTGCWTLGCDLDFSCLHDGNICVLPSGCTYGTGNHLNLFGGGLNDGIHTPYRGACLSLGGGALYNPGDATCLRGSCSQFYNGGDIFIDGGRSTNGLPGNVLLGNYQGLTLIGPSVINDYCSSLQVQANGGPAINATGSSNFTNNNFQSDLAFEDYCNSYTGHGGYFSAISGATYVYLAQSDAPSNTLYAINSYGPGHFTWGNATMDFFNPSGQILAFDQPGWWGGYLSGAGGAANFWDSGGHCIYLAEGAYAINISCGGINAQDIASNRCIIGLAEALNYDHAIFNNYLTPSGCDYSYIGPNYSNDGEVFDYYAFLAFQPRSGGCTSYFGADGRLTLNCTLSIVDGTQAYGYVFTSDSYGNGYWCPNAGFTIADAPNDCYYYGRHQGCWCLVPEEAPCDGEIYARYCDSWIDITCCFGGSSNWHYACDTPIYNNQYYLEPCQMIDPCIGTCYVGVKIESQVDSCYSIYNQNYYEIHDLTNSQSVLFGLGEVGSQYGCTFSGNDPYTMAFINTTYEGMYIEPKANVNLWARPLYGCCYPKQDGDVLTWVCSEDSWMPAPPSGGGCGSGWWVEDIMSGSIYNCNCNGVCINQYLDFQFQTLYNPPMASMSPNYDCIGPYGYYYGTINPTYWLSDPDLWGQMYVCGCQFAFPLYRTCS